MIDDKYADLRAALTNVEFHDDGHVQRQIYDPREWEMSANPATIRALLEERDRLWAALSEITDVAERVDGWQSFPQEPIERARAALTPQEQENGNT